MWSVLLCLHQVGIRWDRVGSGDGSDRIRSAEHDAELGSLNAELEDVEINVEVDVKVDDDDDEEEEEEVEECQVFEQRQGRW